MSGKDSVIRVAPQQLVFGAFELQPTGLVVTGKPTLAEWKYCGDVLQRIEGAVQWWIGDWLNYGAKAYGEKYADAIEATGLEGQTLRVYAFVASNVDPLIRINNVSWSIHREVASLDSTAQQKTILARAARDELTVSDVRAIVRADTRATKLAAAVWPTGKYGVILADPPWRPDAGLLDPTRQIENQYPTATLDELITMRPQVDALALDDCVLLLWTTTQKLAEAATLVEQWGFVVKSGAVWIKPSIGMGYWFRGRHELLILATRGNPMTPIEVDRPDSVIEAPRAGHSEKPPEVYALVERMFPQVPKVEIFARAVRAGWAHATNEESLRLA